MNTTRTPVCPTCRQETTLLCSCDPQAMQTTTTDPKGCPVCKRTVECACDLSQYYESADQIPPFIQRGVQAKRVHTPRRRKSLGLLNLVQAGARSPWWGAMAFNLAHAVLLVGFLFACIYACAKAFSPPDGQAVVEHVKALKEARR